MSEHLPREQSWRQTPIAVLLAGFALVVLLLVILYAGDVFLLIFAGILVATLFEAGAEQIARRFPLGPATSVLFLCIVLAGVVAGVAYVLGPHVSRQIDQLQEKLPQALSQLEHMLAQYSWGRWLLEAAPSPQNVMPASSGFLAKLAGAVSKWINALSAMVLVFFLGVFFAAQPAIYAHGFLAIIPPRHRTRAREVIERVFFTLRWWLVGRITSMCVIGVLDGLGLWLLGVDLAVTLAIISALLTFLPNLGPILSVIPAILVASLQRPELVLWVILLKVGVQLVESYAVTPWVQFEAIRLPPGLTLSAQLLMGVLAGPVGLVVATPLAATGVVLLQSLCFEDGTGESPG